MYIYSNRGEKNYIVKGKIFSTHVFVNSFYLHLYVLHTNIHIYIYTSILKLFLSNLEFTVMNKVVTYPLILSQICFSFLFAFS